MNRIIDYLNYLFPNPKCELNYQKDYELLIAVVLSAQTTDKRVNQVTKTLFNYSLEEILLMPIQQLESILKPLGSYHKKSIYIKNIASSIIQNKYTIPNDRLFLENLSGVGRKSANVVLSEIYNYPSIAVDTHVERVSKRLKLAEECDNVRVVEEKLMKLFDQKDWHRIHKQLVLFGRYHCKAKTPNCNNCQIKDLCKKNIHS